MRKTDNKPDKLKPISTKSMRMELLPLTRLVSIEGIRAEMKHMGFKDEADLKAQTGLEPQQLHGRWVCREVDSTWKPPKTLIPQGEFTTGCNFIGKRLWIDIKFKLYLGSDGRFYADWNDFN